jgi:hypothetical protein
MVTTFLIRLFVFGTSVLLFLRLLWVLAVLVVMAKMFMALGR